MTLYQSRYLLLSSLIPSPDPNLEEGKGSGELWPNPLILSMQAGGEIGINCQLWGTLFIHTYTSTCIQQPLFRSIGEIVSSPDPTLEEGLASGELWPKFLCAGPRIWPKFTRTFSLLYGHAYQFTGCYRTLQIDGQVIGIAYHYAVLT